MNYTHALKRTGCLIASIAILIFLFAPIFLSAQPVDSTAVVQTENTLTNFDPAASFGSIGGLAALVLLATAFAKKTWKTNNTITIVISGGISIIISAAGYFLGLGIFQSLQPQWWYIFIYGVAVMIVANGLSTWSAISQLLTFLKLKTPAK